MRSHARCAPGDELEDEDAQRPVVAAARGAAVLDHLGRQIVRRAAHRVRAPALEHQLGEAQVRQLQVAVRIHQNVLRLQVSAQAGHAGTQASA
jgi:hypothetical protein